MGEPDPGNKVDGRLLRTERSRTAVVDAVVALLEEGQVNPTARMVSERAGVSLSTLFRLYVDLDSLYSDAIGYQAARVGAMLIVFDAEADLSTRIETFVQNRARIFEAITPMRRQAIVLAATSERVRAGLERFEAFLRGQAVDLFDNELAERDQVDAQLLDAVSSWDMWQRLRTTQQLSVRKAKATVSRALQAILAP